MPLRATLLPIALLALAASSCGAQGVDKAGGTKPQKPLVLTLASHDDDETAYAPFAAAVKRLSGGAMQIRVETGWEGTQDAREIAYERELVSDVRAGRAELTIVGTRVWDTLGVTAFQAPLAPFLVDSLALERRALQLPFAARALAQVRKPGVVGIAVLPGRMRRPFGLTRPLVGPRDYRGARIAIRPSVVATESLGALGATAAGYIPGELGGFDGAELDPFTITSEEFDLGARGLTRNVVLWPKPWTIVMNEKAFARLTPEQRQILFAAGRAAFVPQLRQVARDQRSAISILCTDKTVPLTTASASDVATLRRAVQPVYRRIERSAFTRRWIAAVTRIKASTSPDVVSCAR